MAKLMTETQQTGVETAFDWMLQAISTDLNLTVDQALEAREYLIARMNNLRALDLMPEQD